MADLDVKAISLLGMEYQRVRLEAAAMNIANAQVFSGSESTTYKPVSAVRLSAGLSFEQILQQGDKISLAPNTESKAKAILKPEHPLANDLGYVFLPEVNLAKEMITLNSSTRAYEANVKAFNAYKEM